MINAKNIWLMTGLLFIQQTSHTQVPMVAIFQIRKSRENPLNSYIMTEVTHATTNDFVSIQEIAHQTWPIAFAGILSPRQISYMLQMMYSLDSLNEQIVQGHLFLLAKDEGISLGFISYELNYKGCGITRIHKIYILPSAQGKGLGKSLVNRVMGIAIENQNHVLSLNVNRYNEAVHFYERLGFKKVREENISIGNGFVMEDDVMEKSLVDGHKLCI